MRRSSPVAKLHEYSSTKVSKSIHEPLVAILVDETQTTTGKSPCLKINQDNKSISWIGYKNSLLEKKIYFNGGIYRSNTESFSYVQDQNLFDTIIKNHIYVALSGKYADIFVCGNTKISRRASFGSNGIVIQSIKDMLHWRGLAAHSRRIFVTCGVIDPNNHMYDLVLYKNSEKNRVLNYNLKQVQVDTVDDIGYLLANISQVPGIANHQIIFTIQTKGADTQTQGQLRFFIAAEMLNQDATTKHYTPMEWYAGFLDSLSSYEKTRSQVELASPIVYLIRNILLQTVPATILCAVDSAMCNADDTLNTLALATRLRRIIYGFDTFSAHQQQNDDYIEADESAEILCMPSSPGLHALSSTPRSNVSLDHSHVEDPYQGYHISSEYERNKKTMEDEIEELNLRIQRSDSDRFAVEKKLERKAQHCIKLKATAQKYERNCRLAEQRLKIALKKNEDLTEQALKYQSDMVSASQRITSLKEKRKECSEVLATTSSKHKRNDLQWQLQLTEARKEVEHERLRTCDLTLKLEVLQRKLTESQQRFEVEKKRVVCLQYELKKMSKLKLSKQSLEDVKESAADYKRRWLLCQATCRQLQKKIDVRSKLRYNLASDNGRPTRVSAMIRNIVSQQYSHAQHELNDDEERNSTSIEEKLTIVPYNNSLESRYETVFDIDKNRNEQRSVKKSATSIKINILPEFSRMQQIEHIETEEWSRSPKRITDGQPRAFSKLKRDPEFEWRRLALEAMQDRNRSGIERRHFQCQQIVKRKKYQEKEKQVEKLRKQAIEQKSQIEMRLHKARQEELHVKHDRQAWNRKKVKNRQTQHETALINEKEKKKSLMQQRLKQHKYEILWRKKKFHQNVVILDFVNAIHASG